MWESATVCVGLKRVTAGKPFGSELIGEASQVICVGERLSKRWCGDKQESAYDGHEQLRSR